VPSRPLDFQYRTALHSTADCLATVRFATQAESDAPAMPSDCLSPLQAIGEPASQSRYEAWICDDGPLHSGQRGPLAFVHSDNLLFLQLRVLPLADSTLVEKTQRAYSEILAVITELGFPHLLRMWNFLPEINSGVGDAERYKQFCLGRHAALQAAGIGMDALPAATAIGSHRQADQPDALVIWLLAGRHAGRQVENSRQVSAFEYPREYGPTSPSFSRALLTDWPQGGNLLFISGTASVVGHVSEHVDDVVAQTEETIKNIDHLLESDGEDPERPAYKAKLTLLRVYLRHQGDRELIEPLLESAYGNTPRLWLHGDICRRELLLEIEAVARVFE